MPKFQKKRYQGTPKFIPEERFEVWKYDKDFEYDPPQNQFFELETPEGSFVKEKWRKSNQLPGTNFQFLNKYLRIYEDRPLFFGYGLQYFIEAPSEQNNWTGWHYCNTVPVSESGLPYFIEYARQETYRRKKEILANGFFTPHLSSIPHVISKTEREKLEFKEKVMISDIMIARKAREEVNAKVFKEWEKTSSLPRKNKKAKIISSWKKVPNVIHDTIPVVPAEVMNTNDESNEK